MFNVRIYYAHGAVHDFIGISAEDKQIFEDWMNRVPVDAIPFNPILKYTYNHSDFYLDREFVCGTIITSIQPVKFS